MSCFEVRGLIGTVATAFCGTYEHGRATQNDDPADEFYLSFVYDMNEPEC